MLQSTDTAPGFSSIPFSRHAVRLIEMAERIPLPLVLVASRIAVANVFWSSAQSKLASWPITLQLFAMEYQVPIIPPAIAAPLATATELCGAILLLLGFATRLGALALLGVVMVIQFFVYPGHWGEHLLWASLLLLLIARGAGPLSLDHLVKRWFRTAR